MKLSGQVAVVTGGAGGIGLELVRQLLEWGCRVAVCDINDAALVSAGEKLSPLSGFSLHKLDVSDRAAVADFVEVLKEKYQRVSMLFNNAGVVAANALEASSWEHIDTVMNVNVNGVVNMTKLLFPLLKVEEEAYIVNVSSLEGLMAIPGDIMYCTSKYAVRGFSEALMLDNALTQPNVRVCVVHPGFVQTDMIRNNAAMVNPNALHVKGYERFTKMVTVDSISKYFKRIGSTTPKAAANQILTGVKRNKTRVLVGNDCAILDLIFRIFPRLVYNKFIYFPMLFFVLMGVKLIGKRILAVVASLYIYRSMVKN